MSSLFSARPLSLAAVCIQSTALAIVLHVSQAQLRPGQAHYKASSAVLLTELGKLVLSLVLALRDTLKERATLLAPRHALPSPELYSVATDVGVDDPAGKDPYDTTPSDASHRPLLHAQHYQSRRSLRRRSSARAPSFSVTFDGPDSNPISPIRSQFPERSTLAKFQWPHKLISPTVAEKLGKVSPEGAPQPDPKVMRMLDDPRLWLRRRRMGVVRMLWEDVFGGDWWKMAVPAVLFALQNNLIYVAARNLSVPVFQITFQLKTVVTAITAVAMLGRRLTAVQWATLVSLGLGVATMQLGAIHAKAKEHGAHPAASTESMNYVAGISAVLVSCFSSAIAATYFELVIKRQPVIPQVEEVMLVAPPTIKPASLWVRNIQLSLFSSVIGLVVVLFQASHVHLDAMGGLSLDYKGLFDPLEHWYDPVVRAGEGFFEGFSGNPMAWAVIFLQTVGGLLIAVAIKHADNIAKGFALSISIVFTFLLSVILFNFELSTPSVLGATVVVASTLLFETGPKDIRSLFAVPNPYGVKKPALRRWHYLLLVALATTLGVAAFPMRQLSYTSAAWDLVQSRLDRHVARPPTVAVADMSKINEALLKAAGPGGCGWGVRPLRETTKAAYGAPRPAKPNFPYWVTDTNQFALDDILTTRFSTYSHAVSSLATDPAPEFIYLPLLSQIWSNPWRCPAPELEDGIKQTTQFLRDLAAAIGPTPYPRIVVPVTTIRSLLEPIFTPELMAELKDSIVLVSIENAPQHTAEGLKYLIDLPYPTAFHLSSSSTGTKPTVGDVFLNAERPYLLHYAAGAMHPWGQPASDPFNGFALRAALRKEFADYLETRPENATAEILFDDITNSLDGAQNLTLFHEHMAQAKFCPMPAGDSPSRRALYEAVQLGCIPVIFRERSYGRLFPSSPEVNEMSKYSVFVDEADFVAGAGPSLVERLERIPPADVRRMQQHIARIAHKLQWSIPDGPEQWLAPAASASLVKQQRLPDGVPVWNQAAAVEDERAHPPQMDAFGMLLKELARIRDGEWTPGLARDLRRGVTTKAFGRPAWR
ncbi:hypothetical protein JCM3775_002739 [Rhodotorula graminis]